VNAKVRAELERRFEAEVRSRWVRLTCPRCGSSVDVAQPHTQAWCTKHKEPTEMERSAT
jgi:hypothetical protein